ncbi:chloramphenicol acetyltransferase [Eubacteriales bacterium OttesenSCG-928-A19]|nr:chloramphenicol acetyltransferase [Eubacteriales bacterium OttesenSCG-928-A19]
MPGFTPVDMTTWKRAPYFRHYMEEVRCTYSVTAEIDVALLLEAVHARQVRFYPAMLYALAACVDRHEAFRYGYDAQGRVGLWDVAHPSYTVFHAGDDTFSSVWTHWDPSFAAFHAAYLRDQADYGDIRAFQAKPDEQPNVFNVSAMPWTHFTALNLNVYAEGRHLAPIFTIGRYQHEGARMPMPLAVQAHHAVCDGIHVARFFEDVQTMADGAMEWLRPADE